jgi:WD40 repeat protein
MGIYNTCPSCGKIGRVVRAYVGLPVRCPRCQTKFIANLTTGDYPVAEPFFAPAGEPTEHVVFDGESAADGLVGPEMPELIGRFQIKAWLGRGGFGDVYLAFDPVLERDVALKVPRAKTLSNPSRVARFLREAKSAARLRHPHIVPVFDSGQDGNHYYIAAAFIEGRSLDDALLEKKAVDFVQIATLVRALAEALAYAHSQGIVHRDVKPANIMLDVKGAPYLVDFGLAARLDGSADTDHPSDNAPDDPGIVDVDAKMTQLADPQMTVKRIRMGTPSYWSPEQAAGLLEKVKAPTDQYSLGMVLYEMLCGHPAFSGPPVLLQALAQVTPPPLPRGINPAIPEDLEAICLKTLAKRPEDRYSNCQELADDLRRWLEAEETHVRPLPTRERAVRWCKREPMRAWAIGLACVAVLAVLVLSVAFGVEQSRSARDLRVANVRAEENAEAARKNQAIAEEETKMRADSEKRAKQEAKRATDNEKEATKEAERAMKSERKTKRGLAELMLDRAQMYGQQKETGLGMPWLVRSLQSAQEAEADDLEQVIHRNLSAWSQSMHALRMTRRFPKKIHAFLYHPDGQRFFYRSAGTITQGSMAQDKWIDGKELSFAPSQAPVQALALSFDGRQLLFAREKSIYQVDVVDFGGKNGQDRFEHKAPIVALVLSPEKVLTGNSAWAAFLDANGQAWLWNMVNNNSPLEPLNQGHKVLCLAFSPCGRAILMGCDDGAARVWSLNTKALDWTIERTDPWQPWERIQAVAFHPDGSRFLIARSTPINGVAELWSVSERRLLHTFSHQAEVYAVAFSPCGQMAATAGQDRSARLWHADSYQPLGRPLYHPFDVMHLAFHPTKRGLITVDWGQTVRLWEVRPETVGASFAPPAPVTALEVDASGDAFLIIKKDKFQKIHQVVQSHANEKPQPVGNPVEPGTPKESLASTITAFAVYNDKDKKNNKLLTATKVIRNPQKIEYVVEMWDSTGERVGTYTHEHTEMIWRVAISPDGKFVASVGFDSQFFLWKTGGERILSKQFEEKLWALAFSPNSQKLVVGAKKIDNIAHIYDMANPSNNPVELRHPDAVLSAAFSPHDPNLLLTGFVGGALLWDLKSQSKKPLQHLTGVFAVAFSPDGQTVVTGGQDRQARVWDIKTRKLLRPPLVHPGPVYAAALTSTTLVTATFPPRATVHRWPLNDPAKGDLKDLTSKTELISSIRLDEHDTYQVLDGKEWNDLHKNFDVEAWQESWEDWPTARPEPSVYRPK